MTKYKARKTVVDGITFDSKAEALRYLVLKDRQTKGEISFLARQVRFDLLPSVKYQGADRSTGPLWYTVDFAYVIVATGEQVCEDVKGYADDVFPIKRHMMLALRGINVIVPNAPAYGAKKPVKSRKPSIVRRAA